MEAMFVIYMLVWQGEASRTYLGRMPYRSSSRASATTMFASRGLSSSRASLMLELSASSRRFCSMAVLTRSATS